jgi:hypothetical protein
MPSRAGASGRFTERRSSICADGLRDRIQYRSSRCVGCVRRSAGYLRPGPQPVSRAELRHNRLGDHEEHTCAPLGKGAFSVGFQFFNLLNHPNFGFPDNSISDTTFGRIFYQTRPPTSVLGSGANTNVSARMIQVKAQLRF